MADSCECFIFLRNANGVPIYLRLAEDPSRRATQARSITTTMYHPKSETSGKPSAAAVLVFSNIYDDEAIRTTPYIITRDAGSPVRSLAPREYMEMLLSGMDEASARQGDNEILVAAYAPGTRVIESISSETAPNDSIAPMLRVIRNILDKRRSLGPAECITPSEEHFAKFQQLYSHMGFSLSGDPHSIQKTDTYPIAKGGSDSNIRQEE